MKHFWHSTFIVLVHAERSYVFVSQTLRTNALELNSLLTVKELRAIIKSDVLATSTRAFSARRGMATASWILLVNG